MAFKDLAVPLTANVNDFIAEVNDPSQHYDSSHIQILSTTATASGFMARFTATDTNAIEPYDTGPNAHARIHGINFAGGAPSFYGFQKECWIYISLDSSTFTNGEKTITVECHGGPTAGGVAPLRLAFQRGVGWRLFWAGGVDNSNNYTSQWMFGPTEGSPNPGVEHEQNWVGGNHVPVSGEKIDFLIGSLWDYDHGSGSTIGWGEGWARWPGSGGWINIVPRKTMPTCYPDFGGPYMSCYYSIGEGVSNGFNLFACGFADTFANAQARLEQILGVGFVSANVNASSMAVTFNRTLDTGSVPATSAWAVKVNGVTRGVTNVAISGRIVTLTLTSAVVAGDTVTVAYTQPATNRLRDTTSPTPLEVQTFAAQPVTNITAGGGGGGGTGTDPTTAVFGSPIISTGLSGGDVNPAGSPYVTGFTGAAHSDYKIASHALAATTSAAGNNQCYISTAQYGPDSETFWKFGAVGAVAGDWFDAAVRIGSPASIDTGTGQVNAYEVEFVRLGAGGYAIDVWKILNGSAIHLGQISASSSAAPGDWFDFVARGSSTVTLELYKWDGVSQWVKVGATITDSTNAIAAQGYPGFEQLRGSAFTVAGWGAGTIAGAPTPPSVTVNPAITGTLQVGATLTENDGTWTGAPSSYARQWRRTVSGVTSDIPNATGTSYVLTAADIGATIRVSVTATNAGGSSSPALSAPVGPVVAGSAPTNTTIPTVNGIINVSGLLSVADNGTWTGTPTSYSYQWQYLVPNGPGWNDITGAMSQSYTVQPGDVGDNIRCKVTATNANGSATAISNPVGPVTQIYVVPGPNLAGVPLGPKKG